MISEKKLAYYEHLASKANEATAKAIEQLIVEVRKLEKEADTFANMCAERGVCPTKSHTCWYNSDGFPVCKTCWREAARKAVSHDQD